MNKPESPTNLITFPNSMFFELPIQYLRGNICAKRHSPGSVTKRDPAGGGQ
jgi:hypothetical protein